MKFYATPPVDGAFCRYVTIDAEMAHPVPDSMSDEAAALLEPLSVAIATMRKAHVAPGSSILIAGAGPIGVICAQAARAFGAARIVVSDLLPSRRERALRFGATEVLDPTIDDVAALDPQVDAFVDASGAAPASSAVFRRSARPDTSCWSEWAPATSPCPSATSRTWRST